MEKMADYRDQLADLINLLKLPTGNPQASRVREVLHKGDPVQIRRMLCSFGSEEPWTQIEAAPWTEAQIDAAIADKEAIQDTSPVRLEYWAW